MNAPINKPDHRGLKHVVKAMHFSALGLRAAWQYEEAFRLELLALVFMVPAALWLGETGVEYALLLGTLMLVLVVELLNSALEVIVDRISIDHHILSGRAKDIGSAAVFMTLMLVTVVWGAILYDKFF